VLRNRTHRITSVLTLLTTLALGLASARAANNAAVVSRVGEDIRYLASDELEGRGPGTKGLQKAAEYIRDRFQKLGIKGAAKDGSYYRPFVLQIDTKAIREKTSLVLRGPEGQVLKLEMGKDFQPLATGGAGQARAEVVFVGYGISAPKLNYDDYQGADVAGKVVLLIRREPQQDNDRSVFNGKRMTSHSFIRSKIQAAKNHKAAAILLVNDPFTTRQSKKDQLTEPGGFGTRSSGIPFAHLKQSVADQILAKTPIKAGDKKLNSVTAITDQIDQDLTPLTQKLEGWTAEVDFSFEPVKAEVSNILGVIEGEGPHANETIVIGAHYDHLGYGPFGSRRPNVRAIHNGADDNATGTSAIMELARRFAQRGKKPARRLVFIAFTAEERGLIGSNRYLEKPLFPLKDTVAMINFDMIGHLKTGGLILSGVSSAKEFAPMVEKLSKNGEVKIKTSSSTGGSDHAGFYRKGIPVVFFFTGMTKIYHTPDDDYETIDVPGVAQTIDVAEQVVDEILNLPKRPVFVRSSRPAGRPGAMSYLGVVPDYAATGVKGLRLTDVSPDSPASRGGLKAGDVITKLGDLDVVDIQDLANALRKYKPGKKVAVVVTRGDAKMKMTVTLGAPRRRQ
jgi:hypothetical protein